MLKSAQETSYPIVSSFWDKMGLKKSLLVRSEILDLFVNALTADDKYSLHNREKFLQPIQMQ